MSERAAWLALPFAVLAFAAGAKAETQPPLQPYQMVRSLQTLQDRIATGDHAALPMQNKLLELIDARLRDAADEDFAEKRNVRAALVYGMSGGNPSTLAQVIKRPLLSDEDRQLGRGVLAYLSGNTEIAQTTLANFEPKTMAPEIGAFLALVKGSVNAIANETTALAYLDSARLLGPGTLVEEAALRRSLALEANLGKPDRFFLASEQYVRRFLRSPYASQFADSFVTGVLTLHGSLDYAAIDRITSLMDKDQRKVIYLRLARRAGIDGLTELLAFAAQRAEEAVPDGQLDARSELYSSLSTLTTGDLDAMKDHLRGIDRDQLSQSDIRLLEAAESVVRSVTATPNLSAEGEAAIASEKQTTLAATPSPAGDQSGQAIKPAAPAPEAALPAASVAKGSTEQQPEPDTTDTIISDARARLSAIDQMLKEAK